MAYVKVTGTNFIRDTNSMAILNVNENEKNEYLTKVRLINTQKTEINTIKDELSVLKSDISSIKELLVQLTMKG